MINTHTALFGKLTDTQLMELKAHVADWFLETDSAYGVKGTYELWEMRKEFSYLYTDLRVDLKLRRRRALLARAAA